MKDYQNKGVKYNDNTKQSVRRPRKKQANAYSMLRRRRKRYTLLKGTEVNGDKLEVKHEDLLHSPYKIENEVPFTLPITVTPSERSFRKLKLLMTQ